MVHVLTTDLYRECQCSYFRTLPRDCACENIRIGKEVWRQPIHITLIARIVNPIVNVETHIAFYVRTVKHLQESDFIPPSSVQIILTIVVARLCIAVCATTVLPDKICLEEIGESYCARIAEG